MEDEQKLREKVLIKKEQKLARVEDKKQKAIEQAKKEKMTVEQRDIIAESKKADTSNVDKEKLKEAEKLAALIESEGYAKFDQAFENKNRRNEDTLTDDQLVDLFSEMKKETMAKRKEREKEMTKFTV